MLPTNRNTLSTAAQGARGTTTKAQATNIRNKGYRGFKLTMNLKATGAGTVTGSVSEYDESGNATKTWSTGALSPGSGITILEVYPSLTTSGNVYSDVIGASYNATLTFTNGATVTLDATLDMIP